MGEARRKKYREKSKVENIRERERVETHAKIVEREKIRVSSMSATEGFFVLNSDNNIIAGGNR